MRRTAGTRRKISRGVHRSFMEVGSFMSSLEKDFSLLGVIIDRAPRGLTIPRVVVVTGD